MSAFLKSTKGKITAIGAALVLVAAAVVLVTVLQPKDEYRSIVVKEIEGTVLVSNGQKQGTQAYAGMGLFDGDRVAVAEHSALTIELDGDKYMLAESGTEFKLEAAGKAGSDRTVIHLENGSALIRIKNKLTEDQSYVVKTPTSTISVRGTVYNVAVTQDVSGKWLTNCNTFDGVVEMTPIDSNGVATEAPQDITAGFSATVTEIMPEENEGTRSSAFVRNAQGEATGEIDYNDISASMIQELIGYIADGEELAVSEQQLEQYVAHEHTFDASWSSDMAMHWHNATCEHTDLPSAIRSSVGAHTWDGGERTEATHTAEGETKYTCTVCGATRTEQIAKTAEHDAWGAWEADVANGSYHSRTCACGETEQAAHAWDEGEITSPATHTGAGTRTFTCTVCGAARSENIPAAGHIWKNWTDIAGEDYHTGECDCGATVRVLHTWGAGVTTVPASHLKEGTNTFTCTACGAVKNEAAPRTAQHDAWGSWDEDDNTTHSRTCACGEREQAPHAWNAGEVTTPATHLKEGSMTFTCTDCGAAKTESIAKTEEHDAWSPWEAESTNGAYHSRTCACGATERAEHSFRAVPTTGGNAGGTTVDQGNTMIFICMECDYMQQHTHEWEDTYTSENGQHFHKCKTSYCKEVTGVENCDGGRATCTEQAICGLCGGAYGELDPGNHANLKYYDPQEPTCTKAGWSAYEECPDCGYSSYKEIPAQHNYVNGVCTGCGEEMPTQ